jgi:hypothetical protein
MSFWPGTSQKYSEATRRTSAATGSLVMTGERMKLLAFKPIRGKDGSSLRGFADVEIPILELTVPDVPVHSQNGSKWAQIPGKAQTNSDQVVRKPNGCASSLAVR